MEPRNVTVPENVPDTTTCTLLMPPQLNEVPLPVATAADWNVTGYVAVVPVGIGSDARTGSTVLMTSNAVISQIAILFFTSLPPYFGAPIKWATIPTMDVKMPKMPVMIAMVTRLRADLSVFMRVS